MKTKPLQNYSVGGPRSSKLHTGRPAGAWPVTGVAGARDSPHSSGDLKVQWASSDPTAKTASSFTPRNSTADIRELLDSGGQRPALQVSALSSLGA
ncbi:UNVERIFIED_CONTAM: hypothetical protein FKN15_030440 [Acipenser sinensis]